MPSTGIAIVGCGVIGEEYAKALVKHSQVSLVGLTDLDQPRAEKLAAEVETSVYPSLDALLADQRVELVVNLTTHHAHFAVIERCLNAGKHVYSEKPLALTTAEARALVDLADAKGVRLGCAPFTYFGEAQQTAWRVLREGRLGPVRAVFAEANWGRIETWHPAPQPFYEVGALFDVGVYPLTTLTTMFGPARRVTATARLLKPDRLTKRGVPFHIETPDFVVAMVELQSGPIIRLTTNFYVNQHSVQHGIEFHGDLGSLYLSNWVTRDASVEFAPFNEKYAPEPYVRAPDAKMDWAWGVLDMAEAIQAGRPPRVTGAQAAHVVEILCATTEAYQTGRPVAITSTFTPPSPMPWAA